MTTTFITGATGLIGSEYLAHALTQSDDHFILLIRAADQAAKDNWGQRPLTPASSRVGLPQSTL
jgi:NAD dependent epimerase/dehydratase family enzyme